MKRKLLSLAALLSILISAQKSLAQQQNVTVRNEVTTWSGETLINQTEDGHRYKIRLNGSKIQEMYVDDKKVPESDYQKYDAMIKKILVQIEKDRKQAELDRAQAEKDRGQAEKDRAQAEKDREQAGRDREQAEKDREQAEKDRGQAGRDRVQADNDRAQAEKDRAQAEKDRAQAEIDRKQAEKDRKMMNELVDELVAAKAVISKDELRSFILDQEQLEVNGVKQPENLFNKLKGKYLNKDRRRIQYNHSDGFRGISVD